MWSQSEDAMVRQRKRIHLLSILDITVRERDSTLMNSSLRLDVEQCCRANALSTPRVSDYHIIVCGIVQDINLSPSNPIKLLVPQPLQNRQKLKYNQLRAFDCVAYIFLLIEKNTSQIQDRQVIQVPTMVLRAITQSSIKAQRAQPRVHL